jgi:hypothetical protein
MPYNVLALGEEGDFTHQISKYLVAPKLAFFYFRKHKPAFFAKRLLCEAFFWVTLVSHAIQYFWFFRFYSLFHIYNSRNVRFKYFLFISLFSKLLISMV